MKEINLDIGLLPHQLRFINSNKPFTAMVCGRGAGKTFVASYLAAIKAIQGERVILFAQSWASLTDNLMKECNNRIVDLELMISETMGKPFKFNYKYKQDKIEFPDTNGVIYGATYPSEEKVRGYTQISTLILDEAAMSKPDILNVAQPCMRALPDGQHPRTYAITTPKAGSWFNTFVLEKIEKKPETIELIQAKTTDNTEISEEEYENYAGNFTNESLIKQELDGELLNLQAENSVLAGVHYTTTMGDEPEEGLLSIGIDGSGYGKDKTVITYRVGNWYEQKCYSTLTGHDARNEIKAMLTKHPKWRVNEINIDMAYGEKYYENLSMEYDCNLINFGSSPMNDQYLNRRAEMYFNMIGGLRKGLPINEQIEKELNATLFEFTNNGKLKLVNKEEIKLVIGHSPDQSDSLALTYANGDKSKEGYVEEAEDPTLLWNPYD